jgi:homoserine dehydrogenase
MIGCGTVGGGVARLLSEQGAEYARRLGRRVELRRVLVRRAERAVRESGLEASLVTQDVGAFFATPGLDVVVEVAGGVSEVGELVKRSLETGRSVVTANKALLAARGAELFALAKRRGVAVAFEASCGGGIPLVTATQFGMMANRIDDLYGILNGTCNFILTQMTRSGKSYGQALAEAQALGYAEADPAMDVSGRDAAQKLVVLASLAFGARLEESDVWCEGIDRLELADLRFGAELGYDIKLLAIAERRAGGLSLRVHPCFVPAESMIAQVHGSFNAVSLYGHAAGHIMCYGRGAGRMPTASAVVSDLLNVASGWYAKAFGGMNLWADGQARPVIMAAEELVCRYYIRLNALDRPGVMAKVAAVLGEAGVSLSGIIQHEASAGAFVPLAITTHDARQGDVLPALKRIEGLDVIEGRPVCIRIVEPPAG